MRSLRELAADLNVSRVKSRTLVDRALTAVNNADGEGARSILTLYDKQAIALADWYDTARRQGNPVPYFAGIPITIKDLFDVAGEVTRAGSRATEGDPPASHDAAVVKRLRAAGFIILGKTNMTEFAYSGLGMNAHFGTPVNPYDREAGRIPGGSSSGAAISVCEGMAAASIGTDTGGSCRIPAALCGIVGYKPTAARIPIEGAFPLSQTLDSIGPLANTVSCCAILDSIMSGGDGADLKPYSIKDLRFGVPQAYVFDDMDETVADVFERTLSRLASAGAVIREIPLRVLNELSAINRKGGIVGAEAYANHRNRLRSSKANYDPWVANRIETGKSQTAADYIDLLADRQMVISQVQDECSELDGMLFPTTPIIAPLISDMQDDALARMANKLLLRNTAVVNFLDGCALSLPCHRRAGAPVGLMLVGQTGEDRRILSIGKALEAVLSVQ